MFYRYLIRLIFCLCSVPIRNFYILLEYDKHIDSKCVMTDHTKQPIQDICTIVQYSTVQYSTVQNSTVQFSSLHREFETLSQPPRGAGP